MTIYAKKTTKIKRKCYKQLARKCFFLFFEKIGTNYWITSSTKQQQQQSLCVCSFFCFCQITFYSFKQHRYHLNTINKAEPCICTSMTKTHHYHHSL